MIVVKKYYLSDHFISKGGDLMLEVIFQAIDDLGRSLAKYNHVLPRIGHILSDNSTENKANS